MPRQKQPPLKMLSALLKQHVRTLTGVALLAILAGTLALAKHWVSDPYRFPLDVVQVKGDFRHLDKQKLQDAVAIHVAGGFLPWMSLRSVLPLNSCRGCTRPRCGVSGLRHCVSI